MPKVGMEPIRRQQLIAATLEAVHRHGLADTTLTRISGIAGLSSGIVAHYFGGKDGLLEATMRDMLRKLNAGVRARMRPGCTPAQALDAIVEGNFDMEQIDPSAASVWLAFWAEAQHKPELARLQRANQIRLRSNLRHWLGQLVGREQALDLADGLAALIDGLWLRGVFEPGGISSARCVTLCKRYLHTQLPNPAARGR